MGNKVILKGMNIEPMYDSLDYFMKQNDREYLPSGYPGMSENMDMDKSKEMYPYYHNSVPLFYIGPYERGADFFNEDRQEHNINIHNISGIIGIGITDNLKLDIRAGLSLRGNRYLSGLHSYSHDNANLQSLFYSSKEDFVIGNHSYELTYNLQWEDHFLHLAATSRFYMDRVTWKVDSVLNFDPDDIDKTTDGYLKGSNAIYGPEGHIIRSINSLIGHAKYSYKNRYTISLFANYDRLTEGDNINVRDLFPSVALEWDITADLGRYRPAWLNSSSIYLNWGETGNYPLNGLSNDLFSQTKMDYLLGSNYGYYISNLANHFLKHEQLLEKSLGLKLEAIDSRIRLDLDFFIKNNRNLIIERDIPYYYGGGKFMFNIGELENKGAELMITAEPLRSKDLNWLTMIGISRNHQSVRHITDEFDTLLYNNTNIMFPNFEVINNQPLGLIKGYQWEGPWQIEDDTLGGNQYVEINGMKYLNADSSDNVITESDKVAIGNSIPEFTLYWNNALTWKNFRLDFLWYAVAGVEKYNGTKAVSYYTGRHSGVRDFISDTISPHLDPVFYESSYFIERAGFLRLKNLTITYTPEKKMFGDMSASIYLQLENLVTISRYQGYDPESSIYTDNHFSDNAIDYGAYPSSRGFYLGVDLKF